MAQAILLPLLETGELEPDHVIGVVGKESTAQSAKEKLPSGIRIFSSEDPASNEVWDASVKLLATKPQQLVKVEQTFNRYKTKIQVL